MNRIIKRLALSSSVLFWLLDGRRAEYGWRENESGQYRVWFIWRVADGDGGYMERLDGPAMYVFTCSPEDHQTILALDDLTQFDNLYWNTPRDVKWIVHGIQIAHANDVKNAEELPRQFPQITEERILGWVQEYKNENKTDWYTLGLKLGIRSQRLYLIGTIDAIL